MAKSTKSKFVVARASALVRAEHHNSPIKLTRAERGVLEDALRRGEDLREEMEAKVLGYGRWLLAKVFADDTTAALDQKTRNTVWTELVRRAGGPTLKISRTLLYVALGIAAYDKRISDQAWRGLDVGRKGHLLPLRDSSSIRDAARHVTDLNLSQSKTRAYVTELLAEEGKARQVRLTPKSLARSFSKLRSAIAAPAALRRIRELRGTMSAVDKSTLFGEVESLRDALAEIVRAIKHKA